MRVVVQRQLGALAGDGLRGGRLGGIVLTPGGKRPEAGLGGVGLEALSRAGVLAAAQTALAALANSLGALVGP